ncbi:hypothetical protein [Methanoregula sp.]|uniref:hypothetical protein n=1 Tax=Methanoregula sp. TaxID=2052170 RepID=UPI003D0BEEE1
MDRGGDQKNERTRLGVDFGMSNTVLAITKEAGYEARTIGLNGFSAEFPARTNEGKIFYVPSLVHYTEDRGVLVGEEVVRNRCENHPATARWMRKYLSEKSMVRIPAGGDRRTGYCEAATDFLSRVLSHAATDCDEWTGIVFSLPSGAPADYPEWLGRVARMAGRGSCSFVSEYRAAIAGYGVSVENGEVVIVVRMDGTDLAGAAVTPAHEGTGAEDGGMRTLAGSGEPAGCAVVDGWIVRDLLRQQRLSGTDPRVIRMYPDLLREAKRVRELVPVMDGVPFELTDPVSGYAFRARVGQADLRRILHDQGLAAAMDRVFDRIQSSLRISGHEEMPVVAVVMIGEGCAMPAVQEIAKRRFPTVSIYCDRPLEAVARGAALYCSPSRTPDRIRNNYMLRYWDPESREHRYRFLVRSGTRYPSAGQVARIIISAAYDGQAYLGIPLCESSGSPGDPSEGIELVSDAGGRMRLASPAPAPGGSREPVLVNGKDLTLLEATPPAKKGEPRFECTFTLDADRNLCITARDLMTGTMVKTNEPVHRLT